jgi:peptidoglycan/xylan/chitin deacetylase (PgdA/CDA1 family)
MSRWVASVAEALDRLAADGRNTGRLLVVNIHPWLMGHPFRVTYFEELLQYIAGRKDVWVTTTGAIAGWWKNQPPSISPK